MGILIYEAVYSIIHSKNKHVTLRPGTLSERYEPAGVRKTLSRLYLANSWAAANSSKNSRGCNYSNTRQANFSVVFIKINLCNKKPSQVVF